MSTRVFVVWSGVFFALLLTLKANQSSAHLGQNGVSLSAKGISNEGVVVTETETIQNMRQIIERTSLTSNSSLTLALEYLKSRPRDIVATQVHTTLQNLGSSNPGLREKTIWFAQQLNAPEFVPFWTDLAMRKTPALPHEHALLAEMIDEEPTFDSYLIFSEQLQAVHALGALSEKSAQATDVLWHIAVYKNFPSPNPLEVREAAVKSLDEAGQKAFLQLASSLEPTDPLRTMLNSKLGSLESQ